MGIRMGVSNRRPQMAFQGCKAGSGVGWLGGLVEQIVETIRTCSSVGMLLWWWGTGTTSRPSDRTIATIAGLWSTPRIGVPPAAHIAWLVRAVRDQDRETPVASSIRSRSRTCGCV